MKRDGWISEDFAAGYLALCMMALGIITLVIIVLAILQMLGYVGGC